MKSNEIRNLVLGSMILVLTITIGYFGLTTAKESYALEESQEEETSELAKGYFDDDNFYRCVIDAYNSNEENPKKTVETLTVDDLDSITGLVCFNKKIKSSSGLKKLTKLTRLILYDNNISTIDLEANTELTYLNLKGNDISTIDLSANTKLTYLDLEGNNISTIDLSKNKNLTYLNIYDNSFEKNIEYDVSDRNTELDESGVVILPEGTKVELIGQEGDVDDLEYTIIRTYEHNLGNASSSVSQTYNIAFNIKAICDSNICITDDDNNTDIDNNEDIVDNTSDKTDEEITENSKTGNVLMFIAWTVGIGALAYTVYYYKTRKEN